MAPLASFLLRLVAMAAATAILAGASMTLATERVSTPEPLVSPAAPDPSNMTVPDVTGQAYVFAKGILQDRGFAWHVSGPVEGYAPNVVASQQPTAGTSVLDTGAPTVELTLEKNSGYAEHGTPDNAAPYKGTAVELAAGSSQRGSSFTPRLEPVPVPQAPQPRQQQTVTAPPLKVATPAPPVPAPTTPAVTPPPVVTTPVTPAPVTTPPAPPAPAATTPVAPAPPPAAVTAPAPVATPAPQAQPTAPAAPATTRGGAHPPAFPAPGAPGEPQKAQPLPDRAEALAAWLEQHREPNASNLDYWLYEHAYI